MKDFLIAVFAALYAGFLFALAIGSSIVILKIWLHFLG
jgi:hypothetical protein